MARQQSRSKSNWLIFNQRGSITAELAMALPAMVLIISITLGAFALQIERLKMVAVAATAARAIARGENPDTVAGLVAEMNGAAIGQELEIVFREELACVVLSQGFRIPGLEAEVFELSETHCARKLGL
jgi:hypothetical protein